LPAVYCPPLTHGLTGLVYVNVGQLVVGVGEAGGLVGVGEAGGLVGAGAGGRRSRNPPPKLSPPLVPSKPKVSISFTGLLAT